MTPPGTIAVEFTHTDSTEREKLPDYASLLSWAEREGVVTPAAATRLAEEAAADPDRAERVHAEALALRDAVYGVLAAGGGDRLADDRHVATLNAALREGARRRRLVRADDGYEWRFEEPSGDDLRAPLWPVAQSAAELLTSDWLDRVGICSNETCGWLFIDESRNRSRRWCDMSDCGTLAKVRRFRARERAKKEPKARPER